MRWKTRRRIALEYLKSIYRFNEETGAFIIDVRLSDYSRAFSQWDSAWVEVREVDPSLVQYLKDCSDDIPFRSPVEIVFAVRDPRDTEAEEQIVRGVRNYFRYEIFVERGRLRRMFRRSVYYGGVALFFLALAFAAQPVLPEGVLGAAVGEGIYVGGWVFLWEAISQLIFQRAAARRTIADYRRFFDAPIRFETG